MWTLPDRVRGSAASSSLQSGKSLSSASSSQVGCSPRIFESLNLSENCFAADFDALNHPSTHQSRGAAAVADPRRVGLKLLSLFQVQSRRSRRARMFYFHCPPQLDGECCRSNTCKFFFFFFCISNNMILSPAFVILTV